MERTLEPEVMDTEEDATEYDSMDHSEPNRSFVERLAELGAGGKMLDVGTGPGHMPPMVCARIPGSSVLGIDLATTMIDIAEARRGTSPFADRISYRVADAKQLDLEGDAFDAVFSNTILHHIPDPLPFLQELRRVLRPGGTLLVRDLYRPASPERALELVEDHTKGCSTYQKELFRMSLHAAFTPEELRDLADQAGLEEAEITIDTNRHMSLQIPVNG